MTRFDTDSIGSAVDCALKWAEHLKERGRWQEGQAEEHNARRAQSELRRLAAELPKMLQLAEESARAYDAYVTNKDKP